MVGGVREQSEEKTISRTDVKGKKRRRDQFAEVHSYHPLPQWEAISTGPAAVLLRPVVQASVDARTLQDEITIRL